MEKTNTSITIEWDVLDRNHTYIAQIYQGGSISTTEMDAVDAKKFVLFLYRKLGHVNTDN